jgi:hypothetical protein
MLYTESIHTANLITLLLQKNPHTKCPVTQNFRTKHKGSYVCKMCRDYIGINKHERDCPCRILGRYEAIQETYKELMKRGIDIYQCNCSNAEYDQECNCQHIAKYPGVINFTCRVHGMYQAGAAHCDKCKS